MQKRKTISGTAKERRLIFSLLAGACGGLLFGYDAGAMACAVPGIRLGFHLSSAALGLAVSSVLLGTVVGSITAGSLSDAIGRRRTLAFSAVLYIAATLSAAFAGQGAQFTVGRFFCGIAIGLFSVAAPLYLAEVAPAPLRGRIVGVFQLSLSIGLACAFGAGFLSSQLGAPIGSWRYYLCGGILPALACLLALLRSLPSPLRLQQEAADRLRQESLFTHRYLRPIVLAAVLAVFNQLTGVNALLYYVLDVFSGLGVRGFDQHFGALVLAVIGLLITIAAMLVIDRFGRRPLLLSGAAGMALCLFLLPLVHRYHAAPGIVLFLVLTYHACFGFSQGAVIWVYLSEIFPLPVRARGQSLGSTVHWITSMVVVDIFPAISHRFGDKVFTGLGLLLVLQFVIIYIFYPETKGIKLESVTF